MRKISIFNAVSDWVDGRYQKRVAKMKEEGKCPDCSGRGVEMYAYEHFYGSSLHCPGCNGSGLFEDWEK
ncbi:methionine aminopeptidase [Aquibacillus salsiterrae]|uniref:Methionine aminopeptidase n=1 Tax=Aquibacillus salsiterrae TaxID=2950439 RepID=A0A9X4ADW2_9BACI|nr:methionine aminopeptidase [Aquibacillus salsiterrae]MDC3416032.1 methionine aminopeptidase [Aquibacillus salsiterrae]